MDVESLERRLAEALLAEPAPPACAWLFGSRARGEARVDSDVAVAVLLGAEPPATLSGGALSLEGRIEARLGTAIDLVVMDVAPVDLVHRVMRDGRLLFDRDPSARVRFEVGARNAYFDLLPRLREYRGLPAHPRP